MEAPAQVRGAMKRVRGNPRLAVAIAAGTVLVLAWIGWAIYVTTDQGAREGLGVLVAWPVLLAAAALVALPFVAGFLLTRRLQSDNGPDVADDDSEEPAASRESADSGETEAEPTGAG